VHLNDDVYMHYEPDREQFVGNSSLNECDCASPPSCELQGPNTQAKFQAEVSNQLGNSSSAETTLDLPTFSIGENTSAKPVLYASPSRLNARICDISEDERAIVGANPTQSTKLKLKKRTARRPFAGEPGEGLLAGTTAIPHDDTLFERTFRQALMNDVELYHRILRYEPIAFDVFVAHAVSCFGEPTRAQGGMGKFRVRVKSFLDKQVSIIRR
jgi:hypothetical protein